MSDPIIEYSLLGSLSGILTLTLSLIGWIVRRLIAQLDVYSRQVTRLESAVDLLVWRIERQEALHGAHGSHHPHWEDR